MDVKAYGAMRTAIILTGKRGDEFRKLARQRDPTKTRPKYWDMDHTKRSGATSVDDWCVLERFLAKFRPKMILDIGTWFGCCVYAMLAMCADMGFYPEIWTCDRNRVMVRLPWLRSQVHYRPCESTVMLREMEERGVQVDFGFIDGDLLPGDAEMICRAFPGPIRLALHDFDTMGGENAVKLIRARPDLVLRPSPLFDIDSSIAFLETV